MSWYRHAEALYGNSIQLRYTALDPTARYKVRFTQAGDGTPRATRLVANGKVEIHPMRKKELDVKPLEFDIPSESTAGGNLTLEWQANPEEAGNCRLWFPKSGSSACGERANSSPDSSLLIV